MEFLFQFNQKVCYVTGKRLIDQAFFTINIDVNHHIEQMFLYNLINIRKKKTTKENKENNYPVLPGWPTCTCLYGKFSSRIGDRWDPGKIK